MTTALRAGRLRRHAGAVTPIVVGADFVTIPGRSRCKTLTISRSAPDGAGR
jgi:hypothetical protein